MPTEEAGIRRRIAHLVQSAPGRPAPPSDTGSTWRQARCAAITQRCREQLGDQFAWVAYTLAMFGLASLDGLSDWQLEQTFRHMATQWGDRAAHSPASPACRLGRP